MYKTNDNDNINNWMLFFTGGNGVCMSETYCIPGKNNKLVSPPQNMTLPQAIGSNNCQTNPTFCKFNKVFIPISDFAYLMSDNIYTTSDGRKIQ